MLLIWGNPLLDYFITQLYLHWSRCFCIVTFKNMAIIWVLLSLKYFEIVVEKLFNHIILFYIDYFLSFQLHFSFSRFLEIIKFHWNIFAICENIAKYFIYIFNEKVILSTFKHFILKNVEKHYYSELWRI